MKQRTCVRCRSRFSVRLPACPNCGMDINAPGPRQVTPAELAARFALPAAELEHRAREAAVRFGVNPNLSPKERCLAVARKVRLADGFRRAGVLPREPSADYEEDAAV